VAGGAVPRSSCGASGRDRFPQPRPRLVPGQGLGEELVGLHHLDAQKLQQTPEAAVLVARTVAKEDVVKEQLLHHRRYHAVHLRSRLVDQHFS